MNHQRISDRAERSAREVASTASDAADQLQASMQEQFDRLETVIRRNPVASVTAAAGVGLLLAMIARR